MGDHVELARRAHEAANRPRPDFATVNELYAPDHEYVSAVSEVARGARGFQAWFRGFNETWEDWENSLEEAIAIDDQRVLLLYRFTATGRGGGVPVEQQMANVVTVRGGQVVRTQTFNSPEEARASLGGGSV